MATRLEDDIDLYVTEKYGPLEEIQRDLSRVLSYGTPKKRRRWMATLLYDEYGDAMRNQEWVKAEKLAREALRYDPEQVEGPHRWTIAKAEMQQAGMSLG